MKEVIVPLTGKHSWRTQRKLPLLSATQNFTDLALLGVGA